MPSYELNEQAVRHVRALVDDGKVDADTGWSDGKPTPQEGSAEIDRHGYEAYGRWFLGIDPDAAPDTKQRYHFPVGDFDKVYRQGLVHAEQRAAQNDHDAIADAARDLLARVDERLGRG